MNGKTVTCINQLLNTKQEFIIVRKGTGKDKHEKLKKQIRIRLAKKRRSKS